ALCGVSEVYFRKLFLNSFGVSPKEYMIQKRMDYAKNLLKSGDFSISEIATLCGYTESCHFSREFSKREGISPNQYGKQ
ncbi:MAG: helix-turn-helix transcriptional regulator, partial [Ruminococcaceae bacterium]|nr:helix-turn-helix transcriptional regulator [Oscillospiraceae bacterium]